MQRLNVIRTLLFSAQSIIMYIGLCVMVGALILWYFDIRTYGPVIGILLGSGIAIFTNGLFEILRYCSSTTMLELDRLDLEIFENSYRVSALIKNNGGVIVEHAKGILTLEEPPQHELPNIVVPSCNACELREKCSIKLFLANRVNPIIKGCSLAWGLPETPVPRPVKVYVGKEYLKRLAEVLKTKNLDIFQELRNIVVNVIKTVEELGGIPLYYFTDYTHLTSIAPHEVERLLLFDFAPLNDGRYIVRFYSEYGGLGFADPCPRPYRICLYIDDRTKLKAQIVVSGKGVRKPLVFEIQVHKKALDEVLNSIRLNNVDKALKVLQKIRTS